MAVIPEEQGKGPLGFCHQTESSDSFALSQESWGRWCQEDTVAHQSSKKHCSQESKPLEATRFFLLRESMLCL